MRCLRIIATGAALMATAASAAAQEAPSPTPGKPIQLLQILEKPEASATTRSRVKKGRAAKAHIKKSHARAKPARHPPAKQSARAKLLPALAPETAGVAPETATVAPERAAPEPWRPESVTLPPTPQAAGVVPQVVKIASPDEVNEIDLAADAAPGTRSASYPPIVMAPPAAAVLPVPAMPPPTSVGAWAWIVKALAALGGAVVAASAAWFLIGPAPERRHG